jgi:hypothetical protein
MRRKNLASLQSAARDPERISIASGIGHSFKPKGITESKSNGFASALFASILSQWVAIQE